MKKTIVLKLLSFWTVVSLAGCQSQPRAPHPLSVEPSLAEPVQIEPTRPEQLPVDLAQPYLLQTKLQLKQTSTDPQFNAYQDFVALGKSEKGLSQLHLILNQKGSEAFYGSLKSLLEDKTSELYQQRDLLQRAIGKPTLSPPVEVPESGLLSIPENTAYEKALSTLSVLALVQDRSPDADTRLEGHLFALKVGRKACLNAVSAKHYELALKIQEDSLTKIQSGLNQQNLSNQELGLLITKLQTELSSEQEVLFLLDVEYLESSRVLSAKKLSPEAYSKESNGLAAHYLALRPYFAGEKPLTKGFRLERAVPELEGCEFASKSLDLWSTLERSWKFITLLRAVELKAALEAYRLKTGSYPEHLEDLIPGSLSRIPTDLLSVDGSFVYAKDSKGYRLSSKLLEESQPLKAW